LSGFAELSQPVGEHAIGEQRFRIRRHESANLGRPRFVEPHAKLPIGNVRLQHVIAHAPCVKIELAGVPCPERIARGQEVVLGHCVRDSWRDCGQKNHQQQTRDT
jgi:hypothetical protein